MNPGWIHFVGNYWAIETERTLTAQYKTFFLLPPQEEHCSHNFLWYSVLHYVVYYTMTWTSHSNYLMNLAVEELSNKAPRGHDTMRSAWIQPLTVVYWPYTTNPRGALLLLETNQRNYSSKNTCFVYAIQWLSAKSVFRAWTTQLINQ